MKMKYLLKMMTVVAVLLAATTVKAAEITVTGEDRAALVAAFDAAQNGDVILLTNSIEIGGEQLTITKRVTVKGVGDGIEIKPAAGYKLRVMQLQVGNHDTEKLVFENITFRDAYNVGGEDGTGEKDGGLGRIANGTNEFINCKFINNYSLDRGGVWDMYGGNATFTNCEFTGNGSRGRAGAIFTRGDGTKATYHNCKFTGNYTTNDKAGALNLQNKSEQYLYNCILTENFSGDVVDETDWGKNTGGGGAVFATNGDAVLYVENCAIYGNYTLNDHGGIFFADNNPTATFVNTTIADNIMYKDANSMFFCTGAIQLDLINVTYVNNNAYFPKEGDPTGKNGPNAGNSTGIRINNVNARVKIHNSILVGNLSRKRESPDAGKPVAVDIMLQGDAANATNVVNIFEIKNSIIGNIKGLSTNALADIPGISTSMYNFYPDEDANWFDFETKSGINWTAGLQISGNGQAYYLLDPSGESAQLGDPELLAAYIDPLVDQFGKARDGEEISAGAIEFGRITVTGDDRAALQAAFDAAKDGDVILLTKSITLSGDGQFGLSKAITLKGVGENITIKAGEDSQRLFWFRPANPGELTLENLTFTGARNPDDGGVGRTGDGAVDGIVRFIKCKFIDNKANRGGAFDMYGGHIFFTDCEFIDNEGTGNSRSGAVHTRGDNTIAIFTNCKFVGNHANEGGVHFLESRSTAKFYNCIFSENYAGKVVDPEDWTKNTGGGGGVFKTGGDGVLYVENSTIVKNYTLNDHGGVLHGGSNPTVSFVNTTIADNVMHRDANSMFFLTGGAIQFNLINSTVVNNNAYMEDGAEPGHAGPNSGNSTGIAIRELDSRVKIHNSIIAGNLSRDGGLVPVDINLRDNMTPETIGTVLEIKNSVVGFINRLSVNALSESVPGIETSVYNFYDSNADWQSSDKSGINWVRGLTTLENGHAYYGLKGSSSAIDLGEPELLAAFIDPLVDQLGNPREGEKITAGAIEFAAGDVCLDLEDLTMGADKYDPATQTITYTSEWQHVGWEWTEGADFSDYDFLEVVFNTGGITGTGDVEFCVSYVGGNGDGDYIAKPSVKEGMQTVIIPIGLGNRKNGEFVDTYEMDATKVWRIGTKNAGKGTVVLGSLCFGYNTPQEPCLEINATTVNMLPDGSTFDPEEQAITFTGGWAPRGFEWNAGKNLSDYDFVTIEYDASGMPNDNFQFSISYLGGRGEGDFEETSVNRASTSVTIRLGETNNEAATKNPDKSKVWRIGFKAGDLGASPTGVLKIISVCFSKEEQKPVDLVITNVRWEPENPKPGDEVIFYATIKNISEFASPDGEKHGVAFSLNGAVPSNQWCDAYYESLSPGEEVELYTTMEASRENKESSGKAWVCGTSPEYTVKAQVNDSKSITETDYENNWSEEYILTVEGEPNLVVTRVNMNINAPAEGDEVVFTVSVQNQAVKDQAVVDTKAGEEYIVNVYLNDEIVATGEITTALAVGAPITACVTDSWIAAKGTYTLKAAVKDFEDNMWTRPTELVIQSSGLDDVSVTGGSVFVRGGVLYVNYPASASFDIYSLLGQKVAGFTSIVDGANVSLPAGAFIVKVLSEGTVFTHKIVVE